MVKTLLKYLLLNFLLFVSVSGQTVPEEDSAEIQIAFLADVHLQDVYGDFQDSDYKGIRNPRNGKFATIRTMEAQLHSTRIFNENYFAFLAALDDIAEKGVRYVVLPGDFSDDGQAVNIRGLKQILDTYSENHGITFFGTTGNHDPVRPFSREAGKRDYLGEGGKEQAIMSQAGMHKTRESDALPAIITRDIQQLGYLEIVSLLGDFGFFPKEEYLYWETPFSNYDPETYQFNRALEESSLDFRLYPIPPQGTMIPDVSYLVEPLSGLWLLALDANVYIPRDASVFNPGNPSAYAGAGIGYNNVLSHKKHLIEWVEEVTSRARELDKTLLVFSHYPMVEFNDDATANIRELLGDEAMQNYRVPNEDVAQVFADAGVKLHFGGHMHINDTGIRRTAGGNTLINVQIPSLAAYIPAYKLLTIRPNNGMEVETIVIDTVPRYNEMFDLYMQEYSYLRSIESGSIWNKEILTAKSYHEFTNWHLKELVRLRFLPDEWPSDFREAILEMSGEELLFYCNAKTNLDLEALAAREGLKLAQFGEWTGFDLIFDFYRLRNADRLAIQDIGWNRIRQYQLLFEILQGANTSTRDDFLFENLQNLAKIFDKFLNGAPADHFHVDLNSGIVKDLTEVSDPGR